MPELIKGVFLPIFGKIGAFHLHLLNLLIMPVIRIGR